MKLAAHAPSIVLWLVKIAGEGRRTRLARENVDLRTCERRLVHDRVLLKASLTVRGDVHSTGPPR